MIRLLILTFTLLITCNVLSQNTMLLNFEGKDSITGNFVPLDSVYVKNLIKDCDTTLYGNSIYLLIYLSSGLPDNKYNQVFEKKIFPNPFQGKSTLQIETYETEDLKFMLYDIYGRRIKYFSKSLDRGVHKLTIKTSERTSFLLVQTSKTQEVLKLINWSPYQYCDIEYNGTREELLKLGIKDNVFIFEPGDQLLMTGYAIGYKSDTILDAPTGSTDYIFVLEQANTIPTIITQNITQVTHTTAIGGGNVTNEGGAAVTARGICWSKYQEPTINDDTTINGNGLGQFTSYLTGLDTNTTYYVRAYATNANGTAYGNQVSFVTLNGLPCPGMPTITYGGQVYNTVLIGEQCWLKENLNIGTMINGYQDPEDNGVMEKWCYNDDPLNCETYGGLYNWVEAMQYDTTPGSQGICPTGWHIPTDEELMILEGTVDSQYPVGDPEWSNSGPRGFDVGYNLKSTFGWYEDGNGCDLYGFRVLPSGYRFVNGGFNQIGFENLLWSSDQPDWYNVWVRNMRWYSDESTRVDLPNEQGYSVRCLFNQIFIRSTKSANTNSKDIQ